MPNHDAALAGVALVAIAIWIRSGLLFVDFAHIPGRLLALTTSLTVPEEMVAFLLWTGRVPGVVAIVPGAIDVALRYAVHAHGLREGGRTAGTAERIFEALALMACLPLAYVFVFGLGHPLWYARSLWCAR